MEGNGGLPQVGKSLAGEERDYDYSRGGRGSGLAREKKVDIKNDEGSAVRPVNAAMHGLALQSLYRCDKAASGRIGSVSYRQRRQA